MNLTRLLVMSLALAGFAAWAQQIGWPQTLRADSGAEVLIYQPQVEVFDGNNIEARAAISVTAGATDNVPVFGAIWIKARIDANRDTRTAVIRDIEISDIRFADASERQKGELASFIESSFSDSTLTLSLDELLADLDLPATDGGQAELRHDPPNIVLSTVPAMLVSIDGDPVLQQIDGSGLQRVVNSPFLIVRDDRNHYLYIGSNTWYEARRIEGPWSHTPGVPADVHGLVEPAPDDTGELDSLSIIVATEPTELLVSDGEPSWAPIEGVNLLYMDNTDSSAFLESSTQMYYVLLSGRWYRGEGMQGGIEWSHVPNDQLPESFSDIPADSVNAGVLSQVAGTQQAREAVLDNTIPQTAAIDRDDHSFTVQYDGEPDFAPIADIRVEYALNTSAAVFKYGSDYYACNDGVWYVASGPNGPWAVGTEIPEAIYNVPPSNPHHNVTYVKVYDVDPEIVYVGYTQGYYGSYYYGGTVVYGTGWYYRPWYGPFYYPRYPTWGFHVAYNPWVGWGFGASWANGPFRFTFSRHGGWWGVGGYRPYPRPHVHAGYRKSSVNTSVGSSQSVERPNVYDRPENRARNAERQGTISTRQARPANDVRNDVLTDRTGNVYQRGTGGNWSQREGGKWVEAANLDRRSGDNAGSVQYSTSDRAGTSTGYQRGQPPSQPDYSTRPQSAGQYSTRPQLERDYSARQQGMQRSQMYQNQRRPRRR